MISIKSSCKRVHFLLASDQQVDSTLASPTPLVYYHEYNDFIQTTIDGSRESKFLLCHLMAKETGWCEGGYC
jgi:hypothetical protein